MNFIFNEETEKKIERAEHISKISTIVALIWIYGLLHMFIFLTLYASNFFSSIIVEYSVAFLITAGLMTLGYLAPDLGLVALLTILTLPISVVEGLVNKNYSLIEKSKTVKKIFKNYSEEKFQETLTEFIEVHRSDLEKIERLEKTISETNLSDSDLKEIVNEELKLNVWFAKNAKNALLDRKDLALDSTECLPEIIEFLNQNKPLEEKHIVILEKNILRFNLYAEKAPE